MTKVALIIGGSGMLAGLTKSLSDDFDIVGVLGRTESKMKDLMGIQNIVMLLADYTHKDEFISLIDEFVAKHGRPQLVITWIHETRPEATVEVARYCKDDFYQVTGHTGSNDSHIPRKHNVEIERIGVSYHRVTLGRKGDGWLTNDEISSGVINAVKADQPVFVIRDI